jgi:hypothetical protein
MKARAEAAESNLDKAKKAFAALQEKDRKAGIFPSQVAIPNTASFVGPLCALQFSITLNPFVVLILFYLILHL